MKNFVIDYSDSRMIFLGEELRRHGYMTYEYSRCALDTEGAIYAFSPARRFKDEELTFLKDNSLLYTGNLPVHQEELLDMKNIRHVNLLKDELFAVENAILTAEGALMLAIRNTAGSIYNDKYLILGYGRVGKAMSQLLHTLGVDFTIAARKHYDKATARLVCGRICDVNADISGYDVIINTVPAQIFDKTRLKNIKRSCYILDLASCSVLDREDADELKLNYDMAAGIPGKYCPKAAGEALCRAILRTVE